ncbi:MAG: MBL fold metallo-hydrolase [Proteobacteria bacterium]|nr:MBL fold metallo-hydrolase [Pseudomonadota bacterium]MDE3209097.1 MBL fold metallo-hydrolase [Pseudomonadota bacterium]
MTRPILHSYSHGIVGVDCRFVRPGMACAHVIVQEGRAAVVDVGTAYSAEDVARALHQLQIPLEQVDYLILTHVHLDHASGAGRFLELAPLAQLVVHPSGARHMINPGRLVEATEAIYGPAYVKRHYGAILPVEASRVREAPEGFVLDFKGRPLRFLETPGHARHHVCVVDEASRSIFTGDTFGVSFRELDTVEGPFVFPTTSPTQFDLEAAHASIDRLMGFNPERFYLMHYSQIEARPQLAAQLHEFLDHFAVMARRLAGSKEDQEALLYEALMRFLLDRVHQHGVRLDDDGIRALLDSDVRLNAQGLLIWALSSASASA